MPRLKRARRFCPSPKAVPLTTEGATIPGMQIVLNGSPRDCAQGITVATLLQEAGYGDRRVAVEVNREIVPRSVHIRYVLDEGDQVEIVHAIGGG